MPASSPIASVLHERVAITSRGIDRGQSRGARPRPGKSLGSRRPCERSARMDSARSRARTRRSLFSAGGHFALLAKPGAQWHAAKQCQSAIDACGETVRALVKLPRLFPRCNFNPRDGLQHVERGILEAETLGALSVQAYLEAHKDSFSG